jgi:hypothetical protein
MAAVLNIRPAIIVPFVTRPTEKVIDRGTMGLPPASSSVTDVYLLCRARKKTAGVVVLQGSEVAYAFIEEALSLLDKKGADLFVYYVASAELFDLLPRPMQEKIFPEEHAKRAMGITGFTLPTMYRWIRSDRGREMTAPSFSQGALPWERPGPHGAGGGRARWEKSIQVDHEVPGQPKTMSSGPKWDVMFSTPFRVTIRLSSRWKPIFLSLVL